MRRFGPRRRVKAPIALFRSARLGLVQPMVVDLRYTLGCGADL